MKRILITGPVERLAAWCAAARASGWVPIELPLLDVRELGVDPASLFPPHARFDWLVVTSRSALPFVERLAALSPAIVARAAAVGEVGSQRLRDLGFVVPHRAAQDAQDLARVVLANSAPGEKVLWPRGDRARDLGDALRADGLVVTDPVVYASVDRAIAAVPPADAVFFASPSACAAWVAARPGLDGPGLAIAIGETTFDALLQLDPSPFARVMRLGEASPAAFEAALRHTTP
jgi:uroporphyrinogen-III synthase